VPAHRSGSVCPVTAPAQKIISIAAWGGIIFFIAGAVLAI